jgi:hypothetical protein
VHKKYQFLYRSVYSEFKIFLSDDLEKYWQEAEKTKTKKQRKEWSELKQHVPNV